MCIENIFYQTISQLAKPKPRKCKCRFVAMTDARTRVQFPRWAKNAGSVLGGCVSRRCFKYKCLLCIPKGFLDCARENSLENILGICSVYIFAVKSHLVRRAMAANSEKTNRSIPVTQRH